MTRGREFITIPALERIPFLHHGFGTSSWKEKDFKRMEEWPGYRLVHLKQVHSDVIHIILDFPNATLRGDALITALPRLVLIIKTADCVPVLLVDKKKRIIAAVHCGWKGTRLRLLENVVSAMEMRFGSLPADILAALGPSIGASCYEVGEEVRRAFRANGFPDALFRPIPGRPLKYLFDLREANRLQLRHQGLRDGNIFSVDICSHCDPRFPSYRRDRANSGRMLSFIALSR